MRTQRLTIKIIIYPRIIFLGIAFRVIERCNAPEKNMVIQPKQMPISEQHAHT